MLKDFRTSILAIAAKNKVEENIARDMFIANVEKGGKIKGQYWYKGADKLDYAKLKIEWDMLTKAQKAEELAAYRGNL